MVLRRRQMARTVCVTKGFASEKSGLIISQMNGSIATWGAVVVVVVVVWLTYLLLANARLVVVHAVVVLVNRELRVVVARAPLAAIPLHALGVVADRL